MEKYFSSLKMNYRHSCCISFYFARDKKCSKIIEKTTFEINISRASYQKSYLKQNDNFTGDRKLL